MAAHSEMIWASAFLTWDKGCEQEVYIATIELTEESETEDSDIGEVCEETDPLDASSIALLLPSKNLADIINEDIKSTRDHTRPPRSLCELVNVGG